MRVFKQKHAFCRLLKIILHVMFDWDLDFFTFISSK